MKARLKAIIEVWRLVLAGYLVPNRLRLATWTVWKLALEEELNAIIVETSKVRNQSAMIEAHNAEIRELREYLQSKKQTLGG